MSNALFHEGIMDDDEQEHLPTFRHFTRDDVTSIKNLIFEQKLDEKKKAERLAKNRAVRCKCLGNGDNMHIYT